LDTGGIVMGRHVGKLGTDWMPLRSTWYASVFGGTIFQIDLFYHALRMTMLAFEWFCNAR
jgi:hypothetical protein